MQIVTLPDLLEAGVHFGHQAKRWNPKMLPYIYTEKNGIHIIDLVKTSILLTEAYQVVKKAALQGKKFLFLGTKRQASNIIKKEAERCNSYYVNQRWLGGMLTNWITIKSRIEKLKELETLEATGKLDSLPKKEMAVLKRELLKLRRYLNGVKQMKQLPDVVVIVDQKRENTAIQECIKLGILVVSILDTNCNPDLVDVPIPANDDAIRSIKLIIEKITEGIKEGQSLHAAQEFNK